MVLKNVLYKLFFVPHYVFILRICTRVCKPCRKACWTCVHKTETGCICGVIIR
jgi:hypothetical protein